MLVKKKTCFKKKVGKIGKKKNIMFIKKKVRVEKKHCGQKKLGRIEKKKNIVQIKNTDKDDINI